jgi:hypothetical protein
MWRLAAEIMWPVLGNPQSLGICSVSIDNPFPARVTISVRLSHVEARSLNLGVSAVRCIPQMGELPCCSGSRRRTRPSHAARNVASARVFTASFPKTRLTCDFTVSGETSRARAIRLLERPWLIIARTSRSRAVSGSLTQLWGWGRRHPRRGRPTAKAGLPQTGERTPFRKCTAYVHTAFAAGAPVVGPRRSARLFASQKCVPGGQNELRFGQPRRRCRVRPSRDYLGIFKMRDAATTRARLPNRSSVGRSLR